MNEPEDERREIAQRLLELFGGREDVYAQQQNKGTWFVVEKPVTLAVIEQHVAHEVTIGIYPLVGSRTRWGCLDLDRKDPDALEQLWQASLALGVRDNAMLREFSGRKGYHLWIFFAELVEARDVRRLLRAIRERSHVDAKIPIEVFPKQDDANGQGEGMGNLVKLPLGLHRFSRQPSEWIDPRPVEPLTPAELAEILVALPEPERAVEQPTAEPQDRLEKIATMVEGDGRNQFLYGWLKDHVRVGLSTRLMPVLAEDLNSQFKEPLPAAEVATVVESVRKKFGGAQKAWAHAVFERLAASAGQPGKIRSRGSGDEVTWYLSFPQVGELEVSTSELREWRAIEAAYMARFNRMPSWEPTQEKWRARLKDLMETAEREETIEEFTGPGEMVALIRRFCGHALEEPQEINRGGCWFNTEQELFVLRAETLRSHLRQLVRPLPTSQKLHAVTKEKLGGWATRIYLPGETKETRVVVIPAKSVEDEA